MCKNARFWKPKGLGVYGVVAPYRQHVASYDSKMAKPIELKQAVRTHDVPKVLRIINGFEPGSIPTYAADALHFVCYYGSLDDIKTLIEKYKYPTDTQHRSRRICGKYRGTLLHVVCSRVCGTKEEVSSILEYLINEVGLSTDVISEYGDGLPLHVACARHSLDRVKMVSVGCDVNRQDEAGDTPLHMAYQNGSTDMVRYLIEEGKCDINVANNKGELLLHLACKHKYDKEIVRLVSLGCDVNRRDEAGNTSLHMACQNGSTDMVQYLVEERKCDVNVPNNKGELPMHLACKHKYDKEIVRLVSLDCDVNRRDEAGNTPLLEAVQNHNIDSVTFLVKERRCDVNVPNNKGELPLHLACKLEYCKGIVRLVSVGCDVNRQDEAGNTPLHMALQKGSTDIVQYLAEERKCDFNVANNKGELPLHLACKHRCGQKIVRLVSLGCDVNRQDEAGNTPLHIACQNSSIDSVTCLVEEMKCDLNVANSKGQLPLHLACKYLNLSIVQNHTVTFLVKERCDVNVSNSKGELPLYLACKHEYGKEMVRLVSVGCDVNIQDDAGNTPLHIACMQKNSNVVKFLVEEKRCNISVVNKEDKSTFDLLCDTKSCVNLESLLASIVNNYQYQHDVKGTQCALTLFKAVCNMHSTAESGKVIDKFFQEAFIKSDFDTCLCLMMVGECDVYTQIDGIDKCDVVYTLLCKFTSEHDIASTRPTSLIEGDTILHVASYDCQSALIKHLINVLDFSPSIANSKQEYPLHIACRSGCSLEVIELLARCDVNRCDEAGDTPFHVACQNGSTDIVQYLEERKCDVNVANNKGELPLHLACQHCDRELVQLASVGCDVNRQDDAGNTPLQIALQKHHTAIVKFLITCGSNVRTLFEEAFRNNDFDACLCLMMVGQCDVYTQIDGIDKCDVVYTLLCKFTSEHGIACTRPTSLIQGDTILHVASYNCQSALIKHLINVLDLSPSIANSKQEYPLHIACRSGCSLEVIKLLASFDDNFQDIDGNTPLHLACQRHDIITSRFLVKERHCSNTIVNNKGELPLHLACNSNFSIDEIKLVSVDCDVNRQDNAGNTPLHLACGSGKSDIVKFLIEDKRCSTDVVNNAGELPLHLACRYRIGLSEVKLMSSGCSPNVTTKEGNTVLHQFCLSSSEDLEILKFLCDEFGCDPNLSNLRGARPLHFACCRGCDRVVEYLVPKVDVDALDNVNRTPLMCTPLDHPNIIKTLVEHGANPQYLYNTYKHFFHSYSSEKSPPTPLNIIVIGKHGTGKSTLIKALKSEGCQDMVVAEKLTAGIIPSAYESESFGSVIWYDLAGHGEYYASHEAILHTILSASPPLILLLVDIRQDLKYIQQDILYWLNFLHCQFGTDSGTRPHLVIIFSFADLSPNAISEDKIKSVRQNLASDFSKFQLEPVSLIALDCRMPNSDKIESLRSQLSASFKQLCDIAKMNFILHCFYAFLLHNFKSSTAITISDVLTLTSNWISSGIDPRYFNEDEEESSSESIDSDDDSIPEFDEEESPARLLPAKHEDILIRCRELHNKGHIILLKNESEVEKSWLIIQKEVLLNKVNGSLFAPQHFSELSTNTGVVTLSGLVKHFPNHDPDMLIGFLTHMEFCQEINDEVILQLLNEADLKSKDPRYFFFPGLVRIEKPENIWKDDGVYSSACCWFMETTRANEFFTPRFLQVLQLRIAFNFPLSLEPKRRIGDPLEPLTIQRCCSVWKNGISWKTGSGLECLVEVTEQCQAVVLMLRSISSSQDLTSHYISYRSSLIKVITSAVSDICPSLEVSESFCHPDHIQYPPQECEHTALYSLPYIARTICKQQQFVPCRDPEHESIELVKLVTFEPFSHFNFHHFFNSFEKDNVITDNYLRRVSKSICCNEAGRTVYMMSTQEQNIPADLKLSADAIFQVLVDWRDSKHATYSDLHCHLSQYSIFCDRDPQVRMEC